MSSGVARCDSSDKIIYNDTQMADLSLLARVAVASMGDGYIGLRCTIIGSPFTINHRYDLLLKRSTGFLRLRKIAFGSESGLLGEASYDFTSEYSYASVSAVGDASEGDNISAQVESTLNGSTTLFGGDSSYSSGGVCIGTADTNSGSVDVDWIAARKRVNPEPTVDRWWEEQTE